MNYSPHSYEDSESRPRLKRVNYFAWTVTILLLTGLTLAAWLGSFYIFDQPERPDSYRILQRLHKVDPPKRFQLTAAPAGEFLSPKQLFERYSAMGSAELAKTNAELARNYIRNYGHVRGLVPYAVGRYVVMEARELGSADIFTSGMIALTTAVEHGNLILEHLYPADASVVPVIKQTLTQGLEIKLERTHDLSAVIHVERLEDGRIMLTAIPLLYGTYTMTRGLGTFTLTPPLMLNLEAGWPLFKEQARLRVELHYKNYRQEAGIAQGAVPLSGVTQNATPPPASNALVRVEPAKPVETPAVVHIERKVARVTPTPAGKLAKKKRGEPSPAAPPPEQATIAEKPAEVIPKALPATAAIAPSTLPAAAQAKSPDVLQVAAARPLPTTAPIETAPAPAAAAVPPLPVPVDSPAQVAASSATPLPSDVPVLPAQPVPPSEATLASTAGGGNWKTYPPGRMPLGRLINTGDLRDMGDQALAGERIYLRGQFVVNFSENNRAVLRPRKGLADTVLHFGSTTRIIVEYPAGYKPPRQGAIVSRDEARPYEITEVRKQADGQVNVFVREIMQPN